MGGHGVEKMKQYVAELNHGNAKEQGMGPRRTCSAQGEMLLHYPIMERRVAWQTSIGAFWGITRCLDMVRQPLSTDRSVPWSRAEASKCPWKA
jgi:hypothetical protein